MDFLDRSNEERINSEAEGEDRQKQALGVESHKGQEEDSECEDKQLSSSLLSFVHLDQETMCQELWETPNI